MRRFLSIAMVLFLFASPGQAQEIWGMNGIRIEKRWMIGNPWQRGIGFEQMSRYVDARGVETWDRFTSQDNPDGTGTLRRDTIIHLFGRHFSVPGPAWLVATICAIVILASGYLVVAASGIRKRVGRVRRAF